MLFFKLAFLGYKKFETPWKIIELLISALIWRSSEPALWISENQQRMVFAGFHDSKVAKSEVLDYYDGQTKLKQINFPKVIY